MEGVTLLEVKGLVLRTNDNGDILFVIHLPTLQEFPTNKNGVIRGYAKKRTIAIRAKNNDKVYTHKVPVKNNSDDIPSTTFTTTEQEIFKDESW